MGYRLRDGVHYCIASGRTVVFDLLNCRYSALPGATDIAFQALVAGQCATSEQMNELRPLLGSGRPNDPVVAKMAKLKNN
jgi:hypothetical protein